MNERIFELAEQAENYATTRHPRSNIALSVNSEKFLKKFAQLIVQECISVSENHAKDLESQPSDSEFKYYDEAIVNGIYEATAAIKEHFGVEE